MNPQCVFISGLTQEQADALYAFLATFGLTEAPAPAAEEEKPKPKAKAKPKPKAKPKAKAKPETEEEPGGDLEDLNPSVDDDPESEPETVPDDTMREMGKKLLELVKQNEAKIKNGRGRVIAILKPCKTADGEPAKNFMQVNPTDRPKVLKKMESLYAILTHEAASGDDEDLVG